jgi:hypothetical protein
MLHPWNIFRKETRARIKAQNLGSSGNDIIKLIAKEWKSLSASDKAIFQKKAKDGKGKQKPKDPHAPKRPLKCHQCARSSIFRNDTTLIPVKFTSIHRGLMTAHSFGLRSNAHRGLDSTYGI